MSTRSGESAGSWEAFSRREVNVARSVSSIAKKSLGWPNDNFIPEDPFQIVVWDRYGDLATVEALAGVEATLGLRKRTTEEWDALLGKSYGEVIRIISQEAGTGASD